LRVQRLPEEGQVLALAKLAQARSEDGNFTVAAIDGLFHDLSLPAPAKTSNVVLRLEKKERVRRGKAKGLWRLTPEGSTEVEHYVVGIDLAALAAEAAVGGAQLGGAPHPVLLPEFAPPALVPLLRRFLDEHPFDHNVFGMTRFPDEESEASIDPVSPALDAARVVCEQHGLEFHLASDRAMHDDLWWNVAAHMWASRYGIAFFEDLAQPKRGVNYNLTIEVGAMMMGGRRCALLRDKSIKAMPTDLVGHIYKPVDLTKPTTVSVALHKWLRDDLGVGACSKCPS
jgi:hypothetical protein